jgi:predicted nucleic acid-binding protein
MIVVSDASPIIGLSAIGQLSLLSKIYGEISIPRQVFDELITPISDMPGKMEIQNTPWIKIITVINRVLVQALEIELDSGEAEAIVLALDKKAKLLLIDERRGRNVACRFDLKVVGVIGVLVEAKAKGYIKALNPLLERLQIDAGFRLSDALVKRVLQEAGE